MVAVLPGIRHIRRHRKARVAYDPARAQIGISATHGQRVRDGTAAARVLPTPPAAFADWMRAGSSTTGTNSPGSSTI